MSRRIAAAAALFALPVAVTLSFSALWRRKPEPVDPSGMLSPEDYRALLEVVGTYFALRNMRAVFEGGEVVVDGPAGRARYPLRDLAAACSQSQRDRWPQVVGRHFAAPEDRGAAAWPDLGPRPAAPPERAAPTPAGAPPAPPAGAPDVPPQAVTRGAVEAPPRHALPPEPAAGGETASGRDTGLPEAPMPPQRPVAPEPAPTRAPAPVAPVAGAGDAADWLAFRALVRECFRRHGLVATVERDCVVARDAGGHERRFDVPGLYRVVRELRRDQWARFVDTVFGELLLRPPEAGGLAGRSLDEVRDLLAIELFDAATLAEEEREATIYSDDLPGLLSALVCRLDDGVVRVPPAMVEAWGVSAEAVFALALANLRRLRLAPARVELAPGVDGLCWQADDESVATHALLLGDEPRCSGPFGAVVAAPRRGLLLACPLVPMRQAATTYAGAVMSLVARILDVERAGQEVLSRRLYWYRGGSFVELPYRIQTEQGERVVGLYPPDDFMAALSAMGGEAPAP